MSQRRNCIASFCTSFDKYLVASCLKKSLFYQVIALVSNSTLYKISLFPFTQFNLNWTKAIKKFDLKNWFTRGSINSFFLVGSCFILWVYVGSLSSVQHNLHSLFVLFKIQEETKKIKKNEWLCVWAVIFLSRGKNCFRRISISLFVYIPLFAKLLGPEFFFLILTKPCAARLQSRFNFRPRFL